MNTITAKKIYKSRHPRLRLVVKAEVVTVTNGIAITVPPIQAQFENGELATDNKLIQDFIENHTFFKTNQIVEFDPLEAERIAKEQKQMKEIRELISKQNITPEQALAQLKGAAGTAAEIKTTEADTSDTSESSEAGPAEAPEEPKSNVIRGSMTTKNVKDVSVEK